MSRPGPRTNQALGLVGLAGWASLLGALAVVSLPLGPAPPGPDHLPAEVIPVAVVLRTAVAAGAIHLGVATCVVVLAELGRLGPRCRSSGRLPRVVRRLVTTAVGTSLAAGIVVPPRPSFALGDAPRAAVLSGGSATEVAVLTNDDAPAGVTPSGEPALARPDAEPLPLPAPDPREWVVEPGDHLWRIAEVALARARARAVTDAEVAPYWREVVAANRPRLVDPANPDLVLPGQRLVVPEPPAP